jgi:hypothetical protein
VGKNTSKHPENTSESVTEVKNLIADFLDIERSGITEGT